MIKLHTAVVRGRQVKDYTYAAWNDITAPRRPEKPTEQAWNDFHAEVLGILLAGTPQERDNKARMAELLDIADQITERHFS